MDHRSHGPITDAALDRELESALGVDPSPEFLARVRTHIASGPAPTKLALFGWPLAGAAAAALVAIAVALSPQWIPGAADATKVGLTPESTSGLPSGRNARLQADDDQVGLKPDTPSAPPSGRGVRLADRAAARPTPDAPDALPSALGRAEFVRPPFPEVMVSAEEVRAYQMLFGVIQEEKPARGPAEQQAVAESLAPPALNIPDLVIEPLPQIARLE
jgi:hypothetical protein